MIASVKLLRPLEITHIIHDELNSDQSNITAFALLVIGGIKYSVTRIDSISVAVSKGHVLGGGCQ
jgi:hypothetical protein